MAWLTGKGPLAAGLIMAAPVLLIGAPLVAADVYFHKSEPTVDECRAVLAKASRRPAVLAPPAALASRGHTTPTKPGQTILSIFSAEQIASSLAPPPRQPQKAEPRLAEARPGLKAAIVGVAKPVAIPAPAPAAAPARVAALGRTAPLPSPAQTPRAAQSPRMAQGPHMAQAPARGTRVAAAPFAPLSCAGVNGLGLACGSAAAQKPALQASLSYSRLNTRCAGLLSAYGRGGLEGAMIYAMTASQTSARNAGASADAEAAQVERALQKALTVTAAAPRDVLAALTALQTVYGGCPGYDTARNALQRTASLIKSELDVDQPTAVTGFGAALANPGLPPAGSLGTASYSTTTIR